MTEQYLTLTEIEKKYHNQWVLIAGTKSDRYHQVIGGHVVMHHPDGVEFHRLFREWDSAHPEVKHIATLYFGRLPEDEVLAVESEPGAA